jgi:UDP-galactopyranose mutase
MKFHTVKKYIVRFVDDVTFTMCFDFKTFSISNRQYNSFCGNFEKVSNLFDNLYELSIIIKKLYHVTGAQQTKLCHASWIRHTAK